MTDLTRPVRRRSEQLKRSGGRFRRIVVSIYPAGFIGLRLERTRQEELLPIEAAYDVAVKMRVYSERVSKKKG